MNEGFLTFASDALWKAVVIVFYLYPFWLPPLLLWIFWELWVKYLRIAFFSSTPVVLLEVKLPREIMKSPVAMELALQGFYQTGGESSFFARYWEGKTRPWFSLEIASIGGEVRFYIWTRQNLRNVIESQIYAQYPNVEITEVPDYAKQLQFIPGKTNMWATNFKLSQPDPLPIKSYIDYGLDKDPKEEFKNDPLSNVIEFLGSIKADENIALQFVIRAHRSEKREGFFSKKTEWTKEIDKLRAELVKKAAYEARIIEDKAKKEIFKEGRALLSPEEGKIIDSLHRAIQKFPFDVGIRVVYLAQKDVFNQGTITGIRGLFRPFSYGSPNKENFYAAFNSLTFTGNTEFDFPWQDFNNVRVDKLKKEKLDAFKRRMFFFEPYKENTMVMTTEALATLYHFPTATTATPTLARIPSKTAQPPANLPI